MATGQSPSLYELATGEKFNPTDFLTNAVKEPENSVFETIKEIFDK